MTQSRRERRLREAAEQARLAATASSQPDSAAEDPGFSWADRPAGVRSPSAGPGPRRRGEESDRGRGAGRRISESSELHGARRAAHLLTLPALGTLLLAWALTTIVGDVPWGPFGVLPVAFACLSPIIIVPAVPVALVAIQRRRWATLVLPVGATALPWAFVIGYALPAQPPAGPTVPLRAMIVTAHDGRASARDIVDAVRSQRTDVLVVTELSAALAHDLTVAGLPLTLPVRYATVPDPNASPATGIGIFSRFDVGPVTPVRGTHWPAVTARVIVGRSAVTLVAGHVVPPSTWHLDRWRRDIATFGTAERVRGPVLVLVNLNATPWNPQFRWIVSGRLHDAADVLGRGLRPTWPTWTPVPLLPTDHALVASLGVTEQVALPIGGSDHRALSVGLAVPSTAS
ncbi:MAG TPA: endonuclease/exonuclease/phosphatase family protein [Kineosporiaceae bacterium]